jgi:hypothetical protein
VEKLLSSVIAVLLIAAIVLLGAYAIGGLASDHFMEADRGEYGSGGLVYSGGLKNGLLNGLGELTFQDGNTYYGNFRNGRLNGEGLFSYMDDTGGRLWRFDGLFQDGQAKSGKLYLDHDRSMIVYIYGSKTDTLVGQTWRYSGAFDTRGQNGEGVYTYNNGNSYKGGFKNGLADGEGIYAGADGKMIYAGGFNGGRFEGHGVYHSPEGWIYEGNFKDGLFDGEGSLTFGDFVVRGIWKKGKQKKLYE